MVNNDNYSRKTIELMAFFTQKLILAFDSFHIWVHVTHVPKNLQNISYEDQFI